MHANNHQLLDKKKVNQKQENNFLILMKKIVDICNSVITEEKCSKENIRQLTISSIRERLFSGDFKSAESARKLGNNTTLIDYVNIYYLLFNLLHRNNYKKNNESIFINPLELLYGASLNACQNDMCDLYGNIKKLYDELPNTENVRFNKPYFWFDFEEKLKRIHHSKNNYNFYNDAICYYLILLVSYAGLYCDIKKENERKDKDVIKLEKFLSKNKRIIFKSDFRAGKTTFLKHFSNTRDKTVYYFDSNNKKILPQDLIFAIKPYTKFWKDYENIKKGWITYDASEEQLSYYNNFLNPISADNNDLSCFFKNIPKNDIIIIDHISEENLEIIKELDVVECNIIFVPDMNADTAKYDIKEYFYDNFETMFSLLTAICSKTISMDKKKFKTLKEKLGSDALLYKLIGEAHNTYCKKCVNFNLLEKLISAKNFDSYDKIFKNIITVEEENQKKNRGVFFDSGNRSGLYLEDHITNIYSDFFDDNVKLSKEKKENSNTKENSLQLHLIRLLCRLKNEDISYKEIKNFLNFKELSNYQKNIYDNFEKLSWIKNDRIIIPDIVAYAFNRKTTINKIEYKEELEIRNAIIRFIHDESTIPTNQKLYTATLICLVDDIPYLKDRTTKFDDIYKNVIIHIKREKGKKLERLCKVNKRNFEVYPDETETTIALHKQYLLFFLEQTLVYSYLYDEPILWKKAKKTLMSYFNNIPICIFANMFDSKLQLKTSLDEISNMDKYSSSESANYFLLDIYIYLLNKNVLDYLQNIRDNQKNVDGYKINYYKVFNEFRNHLCKLKQTLEFHKKFFGKKIKENDQEYTVYNGILEFYSLIHEIYSQIYLVFLGQNIKHFNFELKAKNAQGKFNTKACENFLVLICFCIMHFYEIKDEEKKFFFLLGDTLKLYENYSGDLPVNISEIVKITKEFLSENNLLN